MTRFDIIHAFYLRSANRLLLPGQIFSTEDKAQIEELEKFSEDGACKEIKSVKPPKAEKKSEGETKPDTDPTDDISTVNGVGAATLKKLEEKDIKTKSQLGAALADAGRAEEMKEVFGANYAKVLSQFQSTPA